MASSFAETIWPTRCVGCDLPGALLCERCAAEMPRVNMRLACPRCGAPYGWLACTECTRTGSGPQARLCADDFPFSAARAACVYDGIAKQMVTAYKDGDELRLDALIADELARAICGTGAGTGESAAESAQFELPQIIRPGAGGMDAGDDWSAWADALVAVPASPENLRRRGYDHMDRIAALCARRCGLPLAHVLQSRKAADQRNLRAEQRAANRAASFSPSADAVPVPARVLLVDDVLTTGATASAAASTLLKAGAAEVRVAVFARVW